MAVPLAGKPKHATDIINLPNLCEERLGGPFCAVRIPWQENGFSNIPGLGTDMDGHV